MALLCVPDNGGMKLPMSGLLYGLLCSFVDEAEELPQAWGNIIFVLNLF